MTKIIMHVDRGYDYEICLEIHADLNYSPGNLSGHPDNWSPEDSECNINRILLEETGKEWVGKLTKVEIESAEEALWKQVKIDSENF